MKVYESMIHLSSTWIAGNEKHGRGYNEDTVLYYRLYVGIPGERVIQIPLNLG